MTRAPHAWEKSYPEGVRWDAAIETTTVDVLLARGLARSADKNIFEFRDRAITYTDFAALVDRFAAGLMALGVGPGRSVAVYQQNTPAHPVSFFAIIRAGGRVVQVSPLDSEREIAFKLKDSGARTLITSDLPALLPLALRLKAAGAVDTLIVFDDRRWGMTPVAPEPVPDIAGVVRFEDALDARAPASWPRLAVEDVALLQYTGGTTGTPKGAMLTHANLTASCSIYNVWFDGQSLGGRGTERSILVLPLFHIFALSTVMLRHIGNGNTLLMRQRFDAEGVLEDIERRRATQFSGVPTMWIAICAVPGLEKRDFSSLKMCSSGGAPLPVEVAERFERLTGFRLRSGYGMTETSPAAISAPIRGVHKPGSCGVPLPGVEARIVALDDPAKVLPAGQPGELCLKGPNVTHGYWNQPRETADAFHDGFLLTGDIAVMDEDGFFFLVDRKKDMILSGGYNVYPRVIEDALYEHPDVVECIVIGVPDPYRGQAAKAFVTLRPGAPALTLEAARAFLADRVGRHEMPAAIEVRDALPRSAVGKLLKRALVEEEEARRRAEQGREVA